MPSNLPISPPPHHGDCSGGSGGVQLQGQAEGHPSPEYCRPAQGPGRSSPRPQPPAPRLLLALAKGPSLQIYGRRARPASLAPTCAPRLPGPTRASRCLSGDGSLSATQVIGLQGTLRHALPWSPPSPVGAAGQHHSQGGRGPCTGKWGYLLLHRETWGWISPRQRPHPPWTRPASSPPRTGRRCACQQPRGRAHAAPF